MRRAPTRTAISISPDSSTPTVYDGSSFVQLTADYYLSSAWTVGGLIDADIGRERSDFGSLPQSVSVLAKLARYF